MEKLWCWRCKMEIPMLDEGEYSQTYELYGQGMSNIKLAKDRQLQFKTLLNFYKKTDGFDEAEPNAIMHH